jgi:hypothetical protein
MGLFGRKSKSAQKLDRGESLAAKPVVNRLVKVENDAAGNVILHVPRPDSRTVRLVSRVFRVPPYKRLALDELGTFVIELCDGENTVSDVVDRLSGTFKLNRREAEVSTMTFLRNLGRRGVIGLVLDSDQV